MPSGSKCGKKKSSRFFSAAGEFIARVQLAKDENFDHNRAYELLPRISKQKPASTCKVQCYTSEIRLKRATLCQSQPPRKGYSYKDIQRYYSFASNPDIIILGCSMPHANTRSYDFLRLDERRVQELPLLIDRARNHPLYLLLDDDHQEPTPRTLHSSPPTKSNTEGHTVVVAQPQVEMEHLQGRSMSLHSGLCSLSEHVEEEHVERADASFFSSNRDGHGSNLDLQEKPNHVELTKPDADVKTHPLHHDPLFKDMCANIGQGEIYDLDMIYVNPDAKQAKRDTSVGHVYMFVARYAKDDKELEDYYKKSGTVDCRFIEGSPKTVHP